MQSVREGVVINVRLRLGASRLDIKHPKIGIWDG